MQKAHSDTTALSSTTHISTASVFRHSSAEGTWERVMVKNVRKKIWLKARKTN